MRNAFIFLLIFGSQLCYGQDTVFLDRKWNPTTRTSSEYFRIDIKDGNKWVRTDYFKSGVLQMKGTYTSLIPPVEEGAFEWHFANGQLEHKGFFEKGKETGEQLWFFENGNPDAKETYRNGQLNGPYEEYYNNGKLMDKTFYLNGLQHGWTVNYREDGKKESEGSYKNGNKNGEWKFYDANENPDTTITFKTDYVIPEAHMFLQLPNDEWFLTEHTGKGQSQYTFKRNEVKDSKGQAVTPSITLLIENIKNSKPDIETYFQQKQSAFDKKDVKLEKKILTPEDKDFPVNYKNAVVVTVTYSENGVEHILYMCYIITKENKGIQLLMDSIKDSEDKYKEEFLKTLQSIKELVTG